jgi:hypothetical protein
MGKLFDDRGNRMTPTHARKSGRRYGYYVSSALAQGRQADAGSVARVTATTMEPLVVAALRERFPDGQSDDRLLVEGYLHQAVVHRDRIEITVASQDQPNAEGAFADNEPGPATSHSAIVTVPWSPAPMRRAREVIRPTSGRVQDARPIRAETRGTLVRSIALGRAWLDEVVSGRAGPAEIAAREGCSGRRVSMAISPAFLAPDLVTAAIEGRLPRGIGVTRLIDPPVVWAHQWEMLGVPRKGSSGLWAE